MNKYLLNIFSILFLGGSVFGQVLRNDGSMNVSAGYLVISGSYQNESAATIALDGIITVTGNWTNNSSTNVISSPGSNGEVIFNGTTQTIGGSANACDFEKLTINSGSTTQVTAGKGVSAYGTCTFTSPLILKSTTTSFRPIIATFINNSTVSGNITMELSYTSTGSSSSGTGRGLHFSSPISNATSTIFDVASGSNLLWYQDEIARKYIKVITNGTSLTVAKGYILRAPTSQVFNFTGTPNTASSYSKSNIPRAVTTQSYLMGNPYPAVIDWQTIATKTNLTNTVWYRTCTTSGSMRVDTWNGTSEVGSNNNGTAAVDGKIPPMQSFWVQVTTVGQTGTLTIEDNDRTHSWGNSQFLKSSGKQNKNLIRLYLYSNNQRDETVIVQSDSAQNTFEEWDSRKLFLSDTSVAETYTLSPEKYKLVIQSVKPIVKADTLPIGMNISNTVGAYKLVANLSGFIRSNNVFLFDKLMNIKQDLFINPEYSFNSGIILDSLGSRFSLQFLPAPTLRTTSPTPVCSPETIDITTPLITQGSDDGLAYTYWKDDQATIPYTTPTNAEAGVYFIKGTAANGSYSISEPVVVTVNATPSVVINSPAPVCSPGTIDLTSPSITNGSNPGLIYTYWIDESATIPYNSPSTATNGSYYIKGTAPNGCNTIAGPIEVIVNPSPTVVTTNPTPVNSPATVDLTKPEITVGSSPELSFSYWLDVTATLPYLTPQSATAGTYYIKGTSDLTGCYAIAGPVYVTINTTGIYLNSGDKMIIYSYEKQIYIDNCKPNSVISIYDIIGRLYYSGISKLDKEVISCNYNTGFYIVKVINANDVKSQKVFLRR